MSFLVDDVGDYISPPGNSAVLPSLLMIMIVMMITMIMIAAIMMIIIQVLAHMVTVRYSPPSWRTRTRTII